MEGTRFKSVSSIQQTATRELKMIWEEVFSRTVDLNIMLKWAGTILSDGINKYFLFLCGFYVLSLGT
jgi:hypothetical protein